MKAMTSLERVMTTLEHELPDRIAVVPQAFMVACKTAGYKIGEINRSGKLMAETHIISQKKFGYDGCTIDIDDATLAEAMGASVIYRSDEVAMVDEHNPLLSSIKEVGKLTLPNPLKSGRLPEWLEATRILKKEMGDKVFILGRADQGPFDLACLLRGTENFMIDILTEDPKDIYNLLDFCRQAVTLFAKAQKDAGAHATSIGDSYAGPNLISPEAYRQFALEHEITLTKEVQAYGIPFSLHICGDTNSIIADMLTTGAKILEVDWKVDMGLAKKIVGNKAVLMGNVDPSYPLVFGTPEEVDAKAKEIIEQTGGRGIILSSGCAMGANTPEENFVALIEAAKKYGTYEQLIKLNKEVY
ncbi:MAG: uroporphyrinogen decarboxylase family protein [Vallitaleaceae bacterium]|nr:uroporphyrinogen decarboxylase family protein [Vallitaleaceae bacterium]